VAVYWTALALLAELGVVLVDGAAAGAGALVETDEHGRSDHFRLNHRVYVINTLVIGTNSTYDNAN
jgi:hypothetical protein